MTKIFLVNFTIKIFLPLFDKGMSPVIKYGAWVIYEPRFTGNMVALGKREP